MQNKKTTFIQYYKKQLTRFEAHITTVLKEILLSRNLEDLKTYLGIDSFDKIDMLGVEHLKFSYLAESFDPYEDLFDVERMPELKELSSCHALLQEGAAMEGIFEELKTTKELSGFRVDFNVYFSADAFEPVRRDALKELLANADVEWVNELVVSCADQSFLGVPSKYVADIISATEQEMTKEEVDSACPEAVNTLRLLELLKGLLKEAPGGNRFIESNAFRGVAYPVCALTHKLLQAIGFEQYLSNQAYAIADDTMSEYVYVPEDASVELDSTILECDTAKLEELAGLLLDEDQLQDIITRDASLIDTPSYSYKHEPSYNDMIIALEEWLCFDEVYICQHEIAFLI